MTIETVMKICAWSYERGQSPQRAPAARAIDIGDDRAIKGKIMRSSCNEFNESAADRNAYGRLVTCDTKCWEPSQRCGHEN
jgi:hypothetical protein